MNEARDRPARFLRLKQRADFRRAAKGAKAHQPPFTLQSFRRPDSEQPGIARAGFTVTKKVGCAVVRNRIRRRLKEAIKRAAPDAERPGRDYVVIARETALHAEFSALVQAFDRAFAELERARPRPHQKR